MADQPPRSGGTADTAGMDGDDGRSAEEWLAERQQTLSSLLRAGRRGASAAVVALILLIVVPWHVSPAAAAWLGGIVLTAVVVVAAWAVWIARALVQLSAGLPTWFEDAADRSEKLRARIARGGADLGAAPLEYAWGRFPQTYNYAEIAAVLVGIRRLHLLQPLPYDAHTERRLRIAAARWRAPGTALRAIGPAWLAVALITGWSALSLLVWATDPAACTPGQNCAGAFAGLSPHPRVGEFVYFVVNALLVNVLPDITAASPVARALFTGIMVSGVALVGRYATALWAEAKELDARKGQIS